MTEAEKRVLEAVVEYYKVKDDLSYRGAYKQGVVSKKMLHWELRDAALQLIKERGEGKA